jgi:hypothetical protein
MQYLFKSIIKQNARKSLRNSFIEEEDEFREIGDEGSIKDYFDFKNKVRVQVCFFSLEEELRNENGF